MNDIVWTTRMLGAFKQESCLSEDEETVLHDWAHHKSITETAMQRSMSSTKVKNARSKIRMMYDLIQPYTPELPPRKKR